MIPYLEGVSILYKKVYFWIIFVKSFFPIYSYIRFTTNNIIVSMKWCIKISHVPYKNWSDIYPQIYQWKVGACIHYLKCLIILYTKVVLVPELSQKIKTKKIQILSFGQSDLFNDISWFWQKLRNYIYSIKKFGG